MSNLPAHLAALQGMFDTLIAEPRKPRCKWCRGKGELGSGRECNHCNDGEPERDDDLDVED